MSLVVIDGNEYEYDEELSFKNFVNKSVRHLDFSNKVIYSSQFYHEEIGVETFSPSTENVTFIKCNLDNISIPYGSILIECSHKMFRANTSDGLDWIVDDNGDFVEAIN